MFLLDFFCLLLSSRSQVCSTTILQNCRTICKLLLNNHLPVASLCKGLHSVVLSSCFLAELRLWKITVLEIYYNLYRLICSSSSKPFSNLLETSHYLNKKATDNLYPLLWRLINLASFTLCRIKNEHFEDVLLALQTFCLILTRNLLMVVFGGSRENKKRLEWTAFDNLHTIL